MVLRDSEDAARAEVDSGREAVDEPAEGAACPDGTDAANVAETPASVEVEDGTPAPEPGSDAESAAPSESGKRAQRGRPRLRLDQLEVGRVCQGKVVGLAKFGAFVDVGAVTDGLVHLTEFSGKRVRKPDEAVALGDEVEVWVKEVDLAGNRISLSMRRKPKHSIRDLQPGDVLSGVVTSTTDYGIFVDIGSDTEGLVHVSEMSSGFVQKPSDLAKSGDAVEVRIKEVDLGRERISLSMIGLANDVGLQAEAPDTDAVNAPVAEEPDEPAQPEEHRPTVVELALRRALGDAGPGEADKPRSGSRRSARRGERQSLGEVYERMLTEYRNTREDS